MTYYVASYCPQYLLLANHSNERKARFKAVEQLSHLVNEEHKIKMPDGFSTKELIRIDKEDLMSHEKEKISNSVKTLAKLSSAKQKLQELHGKSQESRKKIDNLFEERFLTEEEFGEIKQCLKVIDSYANSVAAYKEALAEAEQARSFLDSVLRLPEQP